VFVHGPVVVGLLLMSLNCAHGMLVFAVDAIGYNRGVGPFWWLLVTYGWWMTQLSAILALAVVVTAALPGRTAPAPDRPAHFLKPLSPAGERSSDRQPDARSGRHG
jgi:hypothetical protein